MYLSVDTPRGKQSRLNGIKVQSTNGSGVRGILEYESLGSAVVIVSLLPSQKLEKTYFAWATIFEGSQIPSSPLSIPDTITPSGRLPSALPQAIRLNLTGETFYIENTKE